MAKSGPIITEWDLDSEEVSYVYNDITLDLSITHCALQCSYDRCDRPVLSLPFFFLFSPPH